MRATPDDAAPIPLVPPRPSVAPALLLVGVLFALGAWLIDLATRAPRGGAILVSILAAVVLAFAFTGCYLVLTWRERSGTVTAESILLKRGFLRRRELVVPLESVAAVGLVFDRSGWVSFVWLDGGRKIQIPTPIRGGKANAADDWNTLARTPAGATCIAILERARRRQGASGPIALDRDTARVGNDPQLLRRNRRYWPANRALAQGADGNTA